MRLLLDTHTLLWYYATDPDLSQIARALIETPGNQVLVSAASYWELAIKVSQGKMVLHELFSDFIQHAVHNNGFTVLPIETRHAAALIGLPFHHKDPFDRILVAQAIVEGIAIVTCDPDLALYSVTCLW